jgi:hypothetical protein
MTTLRDPCSLSRPNADLSRSHATRAFVAPATTRPRFAVCRCAATTAVSMPRRCTGLRGPRAFARAAALLTTATIVCCRCPEGECSRAGLVLERSRTLHVLEGVKCGEHLSPERCSPWVFTQSSTRCSHAAVDSNASADARGMPHPHAPPSRQIHDHEPVCPCASWVGGQRWELF